MNVVSSKPFGLLVIERGPRRTRADLPESASLVVRPLPSSASVDERRYYAVGERLQMDCVPGAVGSQPIDVTFYLLPSLTSSAPSASTSEQLTIQSQAQAVDILRPGAGALALDGHEVASELLLNASHNGHRLLCSARNIATREFFPQGVLSDPLDLHVQCALSFKFRFEFIATINRNRKPAKIYKELTIYSNEHLLFRIVMSLC